LIAILKLDFLVIN